MRYFCYIGFLFLLAGCTTTQEPTIIFKENIAKDEYISKIESIVSDAGAGISAVLEVMPKGTVAFSVLEAQGARLGAIKAPTVAKLAEERAIISEDDFLDADKDYQLAKEVENQTSTIRQKVAVLDSELVKAKEAKIESDIRAEQALKEQARATKEAILLKVTVVGIGIFSLGMFVIAFTTRKVSGAILVIGGLLATSLAWIVDNIWFQWVIGFVVGFVSIDILYITVVKTIAYLRAGKTLQIEEQVQTSDKTK